MSITKHLRDYGGYYLIDKRMTNIGKIAKKIRWYSKKEFLGVDDVFAIDEGVIAIHMFLNHEGQVSHRQICLLPRLGDWANEERYPVDGIFRGRFF